MRALVQRVTSAQVTVDGAVVGEIGPGLCVLVAVTHSDNAAVAAKLASKVANLRVFAGEDAFVRELKALGVTVATGVFGADMQVALVNDGPVTLMLEG